MKWNATDVMDTARSGQKKTLAGTQTLATGEPT
jgi:hypothetical protein